jgi:GH15 family glucan-1,4-alpha-glucosidase
MSNDRYPPISDYAFIADCHSSALVSRSGSIDWCCMPRFDSGSCFGRLLDWERGGYCQIAAAHPYETSRKYTEDTLILETHFRTREGEARLLDFFPMRRGGRHTPYQQILRITEGTEGQIDLLIDIVPRFNYGAIKPWIRRCGETGFIAIGGKDGLLISGNLPLEMKDRHGLRGSCLIRKGDRFYLSILYRPPEELDQGRVDIPTAEQIDLRLHETIGWWHAWCSQGTSDGPFARHLRRSATVLKGLSNAPTGAITAAPTTSLPEAPGGSRNWDYRFSWIRDSVFAVRSLGRLGFHKEADGFRRFIERSAAGSAEELQILFGLEGERRLHEFVIGELEGYRGAAPVRIGNAAVQQVQLDVFGELLDLAWSWHLRGQSPDDDYWEFLVEIVNAAAEGWHRPDHGIWEIRGKPRHFVQSKAMCWGALHRGIRLAEELGRDGPVEAWKKARSEVKQAIEEKGYDSNRGVFVQAFGHPALDAALLLLPVTGFIDYKDERMIRTTDAIRQELGENGLLYRYAPGADDLNGKEGTFLACSFWLAECLAKQRRLEEAQKVFERALATGNDLGLFSEEYDPDHAEMLGNFPQALTHLSLINAAVALAEMEDTKEGET